MSDHLPECANWRIGEDDSECICSALRACEQRIREEESRNVIGSVSLAAIGEANLQQYQLGFSEGLDAAREAVLSLVPEIWREEPHVYEMNANDAISVIDALREGEK